MGYLLRQAGVAHRLCMEHALVALHVTLPQFSVLTMLAAYPDACSADLARLSWLTPQTMGVIVANLERHGAVARRAHTVHGRMQCIDITANGRRPLARCRVRVTAVEEQLLAGISRADERVIRRWLVGLALPKNAG